MARSLSQWFLTILLTLFGLLLVQTAVAPQVLSATIGSSWFTWGMLLILAINVLAVIFAVIYLRARSVER